MNQEAMEWFAWAGPTFQVHQEITIIAVPQEHTEKFPNVYRTAIANLINTYNLGLAKQDLWGLGAES